MEIDVLALGESIQKYKNTGNKTVGVNDINKYYPVDYLVVIDLPKRFTEHRLDIIVHSNPKKVFSPFDCWHPLVMHFQKIKFAAGRGNLKELDNKDVVCYSNNSAFVACVIAYKMGAKKINLYGADFNTHQHFRRSSLDRVIKDFSQLFSEFNKRGIELRVTKESRLSQFIPPINE